MVFDCFAVFFLVVTSVAEVRQTLARPAYVNATRMVQFDDLFTNPNRTAVLDCERKAKPVDWGSCKHFESSPTNAQCQTTGDCCNKCQCNSGFPTYLMHLGRCVTNQQLSGVLQNQGLTADCLFRLSTTVSDDGDDDHLCKRAHWFPTVDLGTSYGLYIRLCKILSRGLKMTSCSVNGGRFLQLGRWRNVTNASSIFPIHKKGTTMFILKPKVEAKRYNGHLISLAVTCHLNNEGNAPVSSCVIFKAAGIQTVPPSTAVFPQQSPNIPYTTAFTSSNSHSTTSFPNLSSMSESLRTAALPTQEGSASTAASTSTMTTSSLGVDRRKRKPDATSIVVHVLCALFSTAVLFSIAVCFVMRIRRRGGRFAKSRNEVNPSSQITFERSETFEHQYEQADTIIYASAVADGPTALKVAAQSGLYQSLRHNSAGLSNDRSSSYATLKRSGEPSPDKYSSGAYIEQKENEGTDNESFAVYQDLSGRTEAVPTAQKHDSPDETTYQSLVKSGHVQPSQHPEPEPYYLEIEGDQCDAVEELENCDVGPYYHELEPDSPV